MYLNEGKEQRIASVDSSKKFIALSDGSQWEATGIYTYKLPLWLPMHKAVVNKSVINFKITNINRNETMDVKQKV